ncbi:MAG: phosphate acyltransferase PlsX [Tissierellia bacterium]|nr:phosphate acyltransferase PlsX [Tissierellia bacterium]
MRLGIDVHGGDHAPHEILKGAYAAAKKIKADLVLYGSKEEILKFDSSCPFEIVNCTEFITGDDAPVEAIRRKRDSSMVRGIVDLKDKKIDGFLSAGNSGALMAGGLLRLGRLGGIERPALAVPFPTAKEMTLLLDAGANADVKPTSIRDFALMGSLYKEKVMGKSNPRVAIVNIGEEAGKGNFLVKESYPLLEALPINFVGSIEGRDIPKGDIDVIVTDGFTGNVILKLGEGMAKSFGGLLKENLLSTLRGKIGTLLIKNSLIDFMKHLDYKEYGGAPLLGVKGYLAKAHGSSDAKAIMNALYFLEKYVESAMLEDLEKTLIERLKREELIEKTGDSL